MRIAVAYNDNVANTHYRAIMPANELARRGHTIFPPGHPSFAQIEHGRPPWDLLHVHQHMSDSDLAAFQRLREQGVALVWDSDDDIAAAPKGSNAFKRLGGRRALRAHFARTVEMARAAHLMTTTNEHLAQLYRDEGVEHVTVIENHVRAADVTRPRRRHPGVVIGCTAASEHSKDLETLAIGKTLTAILRAHAGVRVVAIGVDLKVRDPRYTHLPRVPFERLIETERDWDIGLAPLIDSRLNRSRSNIKLKEYAAAGAMWLASPRGPFVGMGEGQGGVAVEDGAWFETLDALVIDHERRAELARRAQRWAATQTIERAGRSWESAFRAAVLRARRDAR